MKTDLAASRPILIVEDDDVDFEATVRGLRRLGVRGPVERCVDPDEAPALLRRRGASDGQEGTESGLPGIIILDLNLRLGDGRELLASIKRDPFLKAVPIVVWSASSDPADIAACYREGANSYIQKRAGSAEADGALERFARYWLETVSLPQTPA